MKKSLYLLILFFCSINTVFYAQQLHKLSAQELIERQLVSLPHSESFSALQVQDFQGRIKPIHTLSLDLLRKIYGKSSFKYESKAGNSKKLTATQVFLGMQFKPDSWQLLPFIKVEETIQDTISSYLKLEKGYAKPASFFDFQGNYVLKKIVADAYAKPEGKRNTLEKNVIKLDERLNITWTIFNGQFLKIFPNLNNASNKWFAPKEDTNFSGNNLLVFEKMIPTYFDALQLGISTKDWTKADEVVEILKKFQQTNATANVFLKPSKVALEISYNKQQIFFKCMMYYSLIGLLLLIVGFFQVFFHNKILAKIANALLAFVVFTFLYHAYGIGLRWYVSGHAPWSNGYEATVFISCICVLAGILYGIKSKLPAAAAALIAVCLLGIAHGSLMNPEITNLVPVLKSYWLLIHVAIITGSYGFLTLGSVLALLVLSCMVFINRNNQDKVRSVIAELTSINEKTTTVGLFMLSIGTFLGGVWANESWGRYWGWDPKETWALISIIIYAFVLHVRIIFKKHQFFVYNVSSLFALSSLIMTFFGVNYYLSGLHSYAKGDPVPIPTWVFVVTPILILLCLLANYRWKKVNASIY